MTRFFIYFSYKWFRRTRNITELGLDYKEVGILLGGLSDCEELVGVTWRLSDCEELGGLLTGDDGVGFRGVIVLLHSQTFQ